MSSKKRIVQTSIDTQENHRGDFRTCPNCDHVMDNEEWEKQSVILVLSPRCYKSGCVAILSECPKCFKKSWVHERMATFKFNDKIPESWVKAVEELEKTVKLEALREWGRGICHQCKHLTGGKIEYHAWRECIRGYGPSEKECEKFEKL